MRPTARLSVLLLVLLVAELVFGTGTSGTFRGFLLEGALTKPGWMYVQSRNNMLRLVWIRNAEVYYADEIPTERRRPIAAESLKPGAEVRVTAHEVGQGRWRAEEIEIVTLAPERQARK